MLLLHHNCFSLFHQMGLWMLKVSELIWPDPTLTADPNSQKRKGSSSSSKESKKSDTGTSSSSNDLPKGAKHGGSGAKKARAAAEKEAAASAAAGRGEEEGVEYDWGDEFTDGDHHDGSGAGNIGLFTAYYSECMNAYIGFLRSYRSI